MRAEGPVKTQRWLAALLVVSLLTGGGWLGSPRHAQAQTVELGHGARFLPADTVFYLAGNFEPDSPQFAYLDRLTQFYVSAPQVDSTRREFSRTLRPFGPYRDLGELWADASPWLGNEAFLAFRSRQDLLDASGASAYSNTIDLSCRDEQLLAGVAIRDQAAFEAFLHRYDESLAERRVSRSTERVQGADVLVIGGSPEGGNVFAAMKDGYLLVSTSREFLADSLLQQPAGGLAGTEGFRAARAQIGKDALAMLYVNAPDQTLGFGGGGLFQEGSMRWIAGSVRVAADSVRVDVTAALDQERMSPANLATFGKAPNPLRSATVVPRRTSFFVGWDNLKLVWDTLKEQIGEETYASDRRDFINKTGIDPDADVFDWMTGEFALYASPSAGEGGLLGSTGLGILIQARDPAVARSKLTKVLEAIPAVDSNTAVTQEDIGGVSFARIPIGPRNALYTQVVGDWLVIASDARVAQDTMAGVKGDGGLQAGAEARFVRAPLPDPMQFYGYVNMPELVAITTSGVGAAAGSAPEERDVAGYSQPIRSVALGVQTTRDRVEGTLFAHVVMPEPGATASSVAKDQLAETGWYSTPVLIDASKEGGAWWGSEQEPTDLTYRLSQVPLALPERGAALARFLHDDADIYPIRTLLPGERVGQPPEDVHRSAIPVFGMPEPNADGIVYPSTPAVVRIGSEGSYDPDEVTAYQRYVRCGGKLLLLSDGKAPGETDELASAFGMQVAGTVRGDATISQFEQHALTDTAQPLAARGGTGLTAWDEWTQPLAFYSEGSYLDLDGNARPNADDVFGAAAMAVRPYGRGVVVFLGTTSIVQEPTGALAQTTLHQLLPDARWLGPIPADNSEPDDTPADATPLPIGEPATGHTLDSAADVDWFQFDGQENDDLRSWAYAGTINLTLFADDGTTELASSDRFMLQTTLPYTGSYFVRVTPRPVPWDACRSYELRVELTAGTPALAPDEETLEDQL
jgi:hypothetical protein